MTLESHLEAIAICAFNAGIGFQFAELFLSNSLRQSSSGDFPESHDRLTVSFMTSLSGEDTPLSFKPTMEEFEKKGLDGSKPLKDIRDQRTTLTKLCRKSRLNPKGVAAGADGLYRYFRYLCVNTFIMSQIKEGYYEFHSNGVHAFFNTLLEQHDDIRKYSTGIISNGAGVVNQQRDAIEKLYVEIYEYKLDRAISCEANTVSLRESVIGGDKFLIKAQKFLHSMANHADDFAHAVLNDAEEMSTECLSIFFGFPAHVYLPWMRSATKGDERQHSMKPFVTWPSQLWEATRSNLYSPINFPAYQVYNEVARNIPVKGERKKGPRHTPERDHLGAMIIWPFKQVIRHDDDPMDSIFSIEGFVRFMNRYDNAGNSLGAGTYTAAMIDADIAKIGPIMTEYFRSIAKIVPNQ